MRVLLGFLLIVGAAGVIAYDQYNIKELIKPPEIRMAEKWQKEVMKEAAKSKQLKTALFLVKESNVTLTEQFFIDLVEKAKAHMAKKKMQPFIKTKKGVYKLEIQVMPFIEDMEYGFVIQHSFIDYNGNTQFEFTINVDVGKLW